MLLNDEAGRDADLCFYCEHVVSELRQFYPDEYAMLELLACKHAGDFVELAHDRGLVKHLKDYGLVRDGGGRPHVAIPVVERYVAGRAGGGSPAVPDPARPDWVKGRVRRIMSDMRSLERQVERKSLPSLFGPNSFPEADKLLGVTPARTEKDFEAFVNVMNRCFVESVERFGQSTGQPNYFWDLKATYPTLHEALDRIKTYRHNAAHLALRPHVEEKLARFLNEDLGGQKPSAVGDLYFVLQHRTLDGLFAAIQIEAARLN
jgi:hypothetical protein